MNIMKKLIATSAMAAAMLPFLAHAAVDVALTASRAQVQAGDRVSVTVTIAPNSGTTAYTAKAALSYPADLLTPTGFSFAPSWLALSQPGYDAMGGGSIIKTGGYPAGFSGATVLGTATFIAKKAGTATVAVTSDTQVYDRSNQNVYSGAAASVSIAIAASTNPPAVPTVSAAQATSSAQPAAADQAAAAATAGSSSYIIYIIILIALVVIGIVIWKRSRNKSSM